MYFYDVWVRSERYRRRTALTYSSPEKLEAGQIVRVPLQRQSVDGVVLSSSSQQPKGIKPIEAIYPLALVPKQLLQLGAWLIEYYRSASGAVGAVLLPATIPHKLADIEDQPAPNLKPTLPNLTPEQKTVSARIGDSGSYLLHGRTGSGKTRLYQEVAKRVLAAGRSVLILSPEISLTSQLADSFAVFGTDSVIVLHSQLTAAQRLKIWRRINQSQQPLVIIGARSAIFSPLRNLGLIVIDEFHEPAYKQEQEPRYHTARVAAYLAKLHDAVLIYGSATPTLADYFLAERTGAPILRLDKSAISHNVDLKTTIIDLRQRANFSRSSFLSDVLLEAMAGSLAHQEQTLLYLNRRGTARISLCTHCGWQALCPHCDVPLAYHGDAHQLRCHSCEYRTTPPSSCPQCGHTELSYRGIGTKALVTEVARLFPQAKIMRFDSDNALAERFEHHYEAVKAGGADILIGTQTLAKGLDLPLLSTLGIVTADSSLQMPDYTATERTFQLVRQVLGRVGRGHRQTTAIIQTFNPENPLLQWAMHDDWNDFYNTEMAERRLFHYPPFYHLLTIHCRRASSTSAEKACQKIAQQILAAQPGVEVNGPAPSFHERSAAGYSWQLVVKSTKRAQLLAVIDSLPSTVTSYDIDPINLL